VPSGRFDCAFERKPAAWRRLLEVFTLSPFAFLSKMTRRNGSINAPIYAVQIIATADAELAQKLCAYKEELARSVAEKSEKVKRESQV